MLLEVGSDIKAQDRVRSNRLIDDRRVWAVQDGMTPLHRACQRGGTEGVVIALLGAGADVDPCDQVSLAVVWFWVLFRREGLPCTSPVLDITNEKMRIKQSLFCWELAQR
jgi:hypothetical protein